VWPSWVETIQLPGFVLANDHSFLVVLVSFPSKNQSLCLFKVVGFCYLGRKLEILLHCGFKFIVLSEKLRWKGEKGWNQPVGFLPRI
jgi:hypothetical protein